MDGATSGKPKAESAMPWRYSCFMHLGMVARSCKMLENTFHKKYLKFLFRFLHVYPVFSSSCAKLSVKIRHRPWSFTTWDSDRSGFRQTVMGKVSVESLRWPSCQGPPSEVEQLVKHTLGHLERKDSYVENSDFSYEKTPFWQSLSRDFETAAAVLFYESLCFRHLQRVKWPNPETLFPSHPLN